MAWPEDKNKPYKIRPSALQRRANEAAGRAFQATANVADRFAGGAGTRQALAAVGAAGRRIADDAQSNTVARQVRRGEIPYGDQAMKLDRFKQGVESRQYDRPTAADLQGKINGQRLDNPSNSRPNMVRSERFSGGGNNDNSATYGPGRIKFTNADFNADGTLTREAKDKAFLIRDRDKRNMAPPDPNSPVRVGNMDVQFSPSVSKEARARFMQDPVRPTAQINRFRARQRVVPQEERIAMPQVPDLDSISDPAARRFAVREYQLAMDRFKANEDALTGRRTTANDTMRAVSDAGRFGIEGRRFQAEQDTAAQERQDRQPQIDLERQMRGLEAELLDPNTTPERRKQIQEMRQSLAGPQEDKFRPVTETIYDETGNPVQQVTNAFSERTGEMRGGQQGGRNLPNDRTKWEVNVPYRAPNGQWVYFDGEGLLPYTGE